MSIFTNRLKIDFKIDAIEKDFVFIRFTRDNKGNWNGAAALDYLIGKDFNAFSVMFQYGKYAYAMFKKPIDVHQLLSRIRGDKEFNDSTAIDVMPTVSRYDDENCICEAWLAQILLNSLSSSKSRFAKYHYCNLTGKLLFVRDFEGKNNNHLDVAKITLNSDYLIKVETVRYRTKISILTELKNFKESNDNDNKRKKELQNALDKPHYKFEESTGSLRIHLPRDGKIDTKSTYIECGLTGKKASTPFLEFGNIDDFSQSRAGIVHDVMASIEKHLSEYMNVNFSTVEIDDSIALKNTLLKKPEQLHSILSKQEIRIVDRVNNEDSADLAVELKQLLLPYITDEKLITYGKRDKKGIMNLRIIHNKLYYAKNKQEDEYLTSNNDTQRQHITIESSENISESTIKTIIKEQIIKRDISSKKLSLFDWSKLNSQKTWIFATCDSKAEQFIFMNIIPDGCFDFRKLDGRSLFGHQEQEYQKYIELISQSKRDKSNTGFDLEGLVVSEENDINLLFRTNEITLPELDKIKTIIKEVDTPLPENKRTGNALADLIQEFSPENFNKNRDNLVIFSDELRELGSNELDKNSFRILMNQKLGKNSTVTRELRTYLLDKHQIRLIFPKDKENLEDLFDSSLNIKYFGETEKEAYYFAGVRKDNVQYSFKDACNIRKIVAVNGSKLIFRELLQSMDVDFVRTGQSTVIPFPFKYIREYQNFSD